MAVKHKDLKKVVSELKNASKMHLAQSKTIDKHIEDMKNPIAFNSAFNKKMMKNPCWKGYEAIGMKTKGGKKVPNCVPKKK
jgi:hypothetical protein